MIEAECLHGRAANSRKLQNFAKAALLAAPLRPLRRRFKMLRPQFPRRPPLRLSLCSFLGRFCFALFFLPLSFMILARNASWATSCIFLHFRFPFLKFFLFCLRTLLSLRYELADCMPSPIWSGQLLGNSQIFFKQFFAMSRSQRQMPRALNPSLKTLSVVDRSSAACAARRSELISRSSARDMLSSVCSYVVASCLFSPPKGYESSSSKK